jgi:hypothetical protein
VKIIPIKPIYLLEEDAGNRFLCFKEKVKLFYPIFLPFIVFDGA